MKYTETNDYELLYLIKTGSEEAYQMIFEKYKGMILKHAKKHYKPYMNISIDRNDLIVEGYVALDKAIHSFKEEYKFKTFLFLCIERQIIGFIRNLTAKKHTIFNQAIYYDDLLDNTNNILDIIEDEKCIRPEEAVLLKERNNDTLQIIQKKLKGIEREVFLLKKDGYNTQEIAITINKDIKCINNALNRIRKKKKELGY